MCQCLLATYLYSVRNRNKKIQNKQKPWMICRERWHVEKVINCVCACMGGLAPVYITSSFDIWRSFSERWRQRQQHVDKTVRCSLIMLHTLSASLAVVRYLTAVSLRTSVCSTGDNWSLRRRLSGHIIALSLLHESRYPSCCTMRRQRRKHCWSAVWRAPGRRIRWRSTRFCVYI